MKTVIKGLLLATPVMFIMMVIIGASPLEAIEGLLGMFKVIGALYVLPFLPIVQAGNEALFRGACLVSLCVWVITIYGICCLNIMERGN